MQEIELKFLDVNIPEIIKKIKFLGAKLEYDKELHSISFYNKGFSATKSDKKEIRLRKIGDKSFITFKGPNKGKTLHIREEIELEISDINKMKKILLEMGFKSFEVKKKRKHFVLGEISFEIDDYGFIPQFLEIETKTKRDMVKICRKLDLDIKNGKNKTIMELFPEKFPEER